MNYCREGLIYELVAPGQLRMECGPFSISIGAETGSIPQTQAAMRGAQRALYLINELDKYEGQANTYIGNVRVDPGYPELLNRMITSILATREPMASPMLALAGTVADMVAECVLAERADSLLVDNGGSISIRVQPGQRRKIGLTLLQGISRVTHEVTIEGGSETNGLSVSGLASGRLTKGVAEAVVAFGKSASVSDACATLIANITHVNDPAVKHRYVAQAGDLFGSHLIITKVEHLKTELVERAFTLGFTKGRDFVQAGLLTGFLIIIQGQTRTFPNDLPISPIA